jgi:cytochrome c2
MRAALLITLLVVGVGGFFGLRAFRVQRAEVETRARDLTGGDLQRGKVLARQVGCVACHVMPGIRGPQSGVGPALKDFGRRSFIAGTIENAPDKLVQFLRDPRSVAPKSAMPNLRLSESEARDIATYLYAQR